MVQPPKKPSTGAPPSGLYPIGDYHLDRVTSVGQGHVVLTTPFGQLNFDSTPTLSPVIDFSHGQIHLASTAQIHLDQGAVVESEGVVVVGDS